MDVIGSHLKNRETYIKELTFCGYNDVVDDVII